MLRKQTALFPCLCAGRSVALFALKAKSAASRGREHLVDFERSEEIYLVICDHKQIKSEW
jgi:hypothetical protein